MKNKWLNLILNLTNRIYKRKQSIVGQSGISAIYNIFLLIVLEIALGFVSLPLYLSLKSSGVTAYLSEKGTYAKVSFDYNLRRVLTLTGAGIFALIWAAKLGLILILPSVYGPLPLYSVSNLSPADIMAKDLIANEIGVQTARVINTMPRPEIVGVKKLSGGNYNFYGKGKPGSSLVLLLSDQQTAVYTTDVDSSGNWQVSHSQTNFKLKEGNHSILVFSYDKKLGVRSEAAPEQFFKVTTSWWEAMVKNVDVMANWSALIILLLGVFLTLLTI